MTRYPSLFVSSLIIAAQLILPAAMAQTASGGTWLDGNTNWNQVGSTLPHPPAQDGNNLPSCQQSVRPPTTPEDQLVKTAGWTLTGPAQIYGATTVITGMANADGMCRPLSYQVFVFTNGAFSGTLSPIPMDSRTDGSLSNVDLYQEGKLDATFNRYSPDDPLCCASRASRLSYEVKAQGNHTVLVPQLPASTNNGSAGS